jgi:sugar/nucleoside kinase (ribokinase family)
MPDTSLDVLTIGNAIVDVFANVDNEFLVRHGLIKSSMRLIEETEGHQLYDLIGPTVQISGGAAANTAAGVASFGGRAAFIGKVRDDQLGQTFSHDIRAQGVLFDAEPSRTGPATARSIILVTPDGERTMNTYLGASLRLGPDDIGNQTVEAAKITYLEGYLWDPPQAKRAFLKAAGIARKAGRKVSLTLSDALCVDRHRASFLELIAGNIDILFANESEIKALYQLPTFDAAMQRARQDIGLAVLTRSAAGSVIVSGEEFHVVEAKKIETLTDATGAGDLFAAGFLHGLTQDKPLTQCARLGSLAAAEVISHVGARPRTSLAGLAREAGELPATDETAPR